jgi:hypothetical protein
MSKAVKVPKIMLAVVRAAEKVAEKHPELFGSSDNAKYDVMFYALYLLDKALGGGGLNGDEWFIKEVKKIVRELGKPTESVKTVSVNSGVFEWVDSSTRLTLYCKNGHRLLILQPITGGRVPALVSELRRFRLKCPVCGASELYLKFEVVGGDGG